MDWCDGSLPSSGAITSTLGVLVLVIDTTLQVALFFIDIAKAESKTSKIDFKVDKGVCSCALSMQVSFFEQIRNAEIHLRINYETDT